MELLPAQLVKLKWLRAKIAYLSQNDSEYVQEVSQILSASSKLEVHPITTLMIESLYEEYRPKLAELGVK